MEKKTKRKPKNRDLVSSDPESDENQDFVEINGDKESDEVYSEIKSHLNKLGYEEK